MCLPLPCGSTAVASSPPQAAMERTTAEASQTSSVTGPDTEHMQPLTLSCDFPPTAWHEGNAAQL